MTRIILNSSISGVKPSPTEIDAGQLAVNLADKILYSKNAAGEVIVIGGGGDGGSSTGVATLAPTAPANPVNGQFWVDTSRDPEVLNIWYDAASRWVEFHTDSVNDEIERKVYITDIQPTGAGIVNLTDNGQGDILTFETADPEVSVSLRCISDTTYVPEVEIGIKIGTSQTITSVVNVTGFTLSHGYWIVDVTVPVTALIGGGSIIATHANGSTAEVTAAVNASPELTAQFNGSLNLNQVYPEYDNGQTHLKDGDSIDITVFSTNELSQIRIRRAFTGESSWNGFQSQTFNNPAGGSFDIGLQRWVYFITASINSAGAVGPRSLKISGTSISGFDTAIYESRSETIQQEGVTYFNWDDNKPAATFGNVTYPAGQTSVKGTESATIEFIAGTGDQAASTFLFTSPDFDITNPTVNENPKTVTRLVSGSTNVTSGTNITCEMFKVSNQSSATVEGLVRIVAGTTTLIITPQTRFISGGLIEDGIRGGLGELLTNTAPQDHEIIVVASQPLSTFDMDEDTPYGQLIGTWVDEGGGVAWSNTLRVDDTDPRGNADWQNISGLTVSGDPVDGTGVSTNYEIGGFVERHFELNNGLLGERCFDLGVNVSDISKVDAIFELTGGKMSYSNSIQDVVRGYTLLNTPVIPTYPPLSDPNYEDNLVDVFDLNQLATKFSSNITPNGRYFLWLDQDAFISGIITHEFRVKEDS